MTTETTEYFEWGFRAEDGREIWAEPCVEGVWTPHTPNMPWFDVYDDDPAVNEATVRDAARDAGIPGVPLRRRVVVTTYNAETL